MKDAGTALQFLREVDRVTGHPEWFGDTSRLAKRACAASLDQPLSRAAQGSRMAESIVVLFQWPCGTASTHRVLLASGRRSRATLPRGPDSSRKTSDFLFWFFGQFRDGLTGNSGRQNVEVIKILTRLVTREAAAVFGHDPLDLRVEHRGFLEVDTPRFHGCCPIASAMVGGLWFYGSSYVHRCRSPAGNETIYEMGSFSGSRWA